MTKVNINAWDTLIDIKDYMIETLNDFGQERSDEDMERFNQEGWINRVWVGDNFRRAHIDIVDARESKKLLMMHVCIFPDLTSDSPIFGFDVIAGEKKMTGAFLDLSPSTNPDHQMIKDFAELTSRLEWKRERELPDWGKAIFSDGMIAAGNVNTQEEADRIGRLARLMFHHYLLSLQFSRWNEDIQKVRDAHNRYAYYQKQNPHTPRVMKSLGLNEEDVDVFIQDVLFPET